MRYGSTLAVTILLFFVLFVLNFHRENFFRARFNERKYFLLECEITHRIIVGGGKMNYCNFHN